MFKMLKENDEPTIFGRCLTFVLMCVTLMIGYFIFILISLSAPYSLLVFGILFWWGYYKFELVINGAEANNSRIFYHLKEDFKTSFIPGYRLYRTKRDWMPIYQRSYGKDGIEERMVELSKGYPGPIHFIFTHLIIPFGLFVAYFFV